MLLNRGFRVDEPEHERGRSLAQGGERVSAHPQQRSSRLGRMREQVALHSARGQASEVEVLEAELLRDRIAYWVVVGIAALSVLMTPSGWHGDRDTLLDLGGTLIILGVSSVCLVVMRRQQAALKRCIACCVAAEVREVS